MNDFDEASQGALAAIVDALDRVDLDCDVAQKGDGIIEIALEDGSRVIVNRHSAAREIWVAARSGGFHFRLTGGQWVSTRSGECLFEVLSRCLSEQAGCSVRLVPPQ